MLKVMTATAFVAVLLSGFGPSDVSGQYYWPAYQCGFCSTFIPLHEFHTASPTPTGTRKCDGNGGCHVGTWWTGSCWAQHSECPTGGQEEEQQLAEAIEHQDRGGILEALEAFSGWEFDPSTRTLSIQDCSGFIMARAPVPQSIRLPLGQPVAARTSVAAMAPASGH
jgi:hypothetical protein